MGEASGGSGFGGFPGSVGVGDLCGGTVVEVGRSQALVMLDGFAARPIGVVGTLDASWRVRFADAVAVGQRITAEVTAVDLDQERVWLSMAATENPELWAFLKRFRHGEVLTGTVAAIERFGVFVALDEGPDHPVYPGVGFITYPELSWRRYEDVSEVVAVGQRVACGFLQFDTWNGEARLSLRALQPDPFVVFADSVVVGQRLPGRVTKLVPFGVFVQVADGIEGLVHLRDLGGAPEAAPEEVVQVGDEIAVVVTDVDRERRRVNLARRPATS